MAKEELMGAAEVAELLGVTTQRIDQLVRASVWGFPQPVAHLRAGRIWRRVDVEAFAKKQRAAKERASRRRER